MIRRQPVDTGFTGFPWGHRFAGGSRPNPGHHVRYLAVFHPRGAPQSADAAPARPRKNDGALPPAHHRARSYRAAVARDSRAQRKRPAGAAADFRPVHDFEPEHGGRAGPHGIARSHHEGALCRGPAARARFADEEKPSARQSDFEGTRGTLCGARRGSGAGRGGAGLSREGERLREQSANRSAGLTARMRRTHLPVRRAW